MSRRSSHRCFAVIFSSVSSVLSVLRLFVDLLFDLHPAPQIDDDLVFRYHRPFRIMPFFDWGLIHCQSICCRHPDQGLFSGSSAGEDEAMPFLTSPETKKGTDLADRERSANQCRFF